jgi:hypothetical protein
MTNQRNVTGQPFSKIRGRFWMWLANHLHWLSEEAEARAYALAGAEVFYPDDADLVKAHTLAQVRAWRDRQP